MAITSNVSSMQCVCLVEITCFFLPAAKFDFYSPGGRVVLEAERIPMVQSKPQKNNIFLKLWFSLRVTEGNRIVALLHCSVMLLNLSRGKQTQTHLFLRDSVLSRI